MLFGVFHFSSVNQSATFHTHTHHTHTHTHTHTHRHTHTHTCNQKSLKQTDIRKNKVRRHFRNADWGSRTNSELAVQLMDCFKEKAKEGGRQRGIVCCTHDKPRHTVRSPNNVALWKERWCPLGVFIGTVYSIP